MHTLCVCKCKYVCVNVQLTWMCGRQYMYVKSALLCALHKYGGWMEERRKMNRREGRMGEGWKREKKRRERDTHTERSIPQS